MTGYRFIIGLGAIGGVVVWGVAAGCATVSDAEGGGIAPCVGPSCPYDAAPDKKLPEETSVPEAGADAPSPAKLSALCGNVEQCIPDYADPGGCGTIEAGTTPPAEAGADGGISDEDASSPFSPNIGSGIPDAELPAYGCQVTRGQEGQPVSLCMPAGSGSSGAPCVKSADCAAGYACVGDTSAAQCRPYCCHDPEVCPADTFCAAQPLRQEDGTMGLLVPVCVRADDCNLAEPYPCPAGANCVCKGDTACMVVRDKTTSCIVPGDGQEGDACPCAWGHVCSKSVNQCLKLCSTASSATDCGAKQCTPMPYLPTGWGVCT